MDLAKDLEPLVTIVVQLMHLILKLMGQHQCELIYNQDEKQTTLSFKPKNESGDGETVGNLVAASFSVDACRKVLAKKIIIDE